MDGEGNVVGHPMKRQDNKSCEPILGKHVYHYLRFDMK